MLNKINIQNFGPLADIRWKDPSPQLNVIIGENANGKTFLLKALYTSVRAVEEYQRGQGNRSFKEVLNSKLYWTFQPEKLGDLVKKGAKERLQFSANVDKQPVTYGFTSSAEKGVSRTTESLRPRRAMSLFLPSTEVLSLFHVIKKSREVDEEFGYDDTYLDLVRALEKAPTMGRNYPTFAEARSILKKEVRGKLVYEGKKWKIKDGNVSYPIHLVAEGYKRIAFIDWLLGNRTLSPSSILFIDEPDAMLHPQAILKMMDALGSLASAKMQIFLSTHSYFVIKKLSLMAKAGIDVRGISLKDGVGTPFNLADGMPENSIIDTSIKLFVEEMKVQG